MLAAGRIEGAASSVGLAPAPKSRRRPAGIRRAAGVSTPGAGRKGGGGVLDPRRGRAGDGLAGPGDRRRGRAGLGRSDPHGLCDTGGEGHSGRPTSPGSSATSSASTGSIRTVVVFGGFGAPVAALVFALFVGLGALQFLAIALIDRHLDRLFDAMAHPLGDGRRDGRVAHAPAFPLAFRPYADRVHADRAGGRHRRRDWRSRS